MERLSLNGDWHMQQEGWEEWIPAVVPGSVYNDLLQAGRMEDPFWRANEADALAEVFVNGQQVGSADNMHREWSLRNPKAQILREGSYEASVAALSAEWVGEEDFADAGTKAVGIISGEPKGIRLRSMYDIR